MKVSREKEENNQVFLRVEMEAAEVEKYLDKAYHVVVKRANVPGFRKGKAPRAILERHVGRGGLMEEALDQLLPEASEQALKEQGIEAFAPPSVEIEQAEPLVFKAVVPLKPRVQLGDFKQIRLTPEEIDVTEERVNSVIEQLQRQHGTWAPMTREIEFNDLVTLDIESSADGEPYFSQNGVQYEVLPERPFPAPGFAEQLVGLKAGAEKEFRITLPQDFQRAEMAGKEIDFKVKAVEVKALQLHEADDELAAAVDPELKTLEALRERVNTTLQLRAAEQAQEAFEEQVMEAVVEASQVEFPPVLVETEIDRLIEQQARWLQASGAGIEEYLKQVNKSPEALREEARPTAVKRVTRSLVLDEVAEAEKVAADEAEVAAEVEKLVQSSGGKEEDIKKLLELPQTRRSVEQVIVRRKTLQRLTEIARSSAEDKVQ